MSYRGDEGGQPLLSFTRANMEPSPAHLQRMLDAYRAKLGLKPSTAAKLSLVDGREPT